MEKNYFTSTQKFTHGGARPGAGRPKSSSEPRKAHSFSCTDAEAQYLKKLLAFIREHNELIDAYCQKLHQEKSKATSFFGVKVTNELQWFISEDIRTENLKNKLDKSNNEFQWLESEAEKAQRKAEPSKDKEDYTARVLAEILVQA